MQEEVECNYEDDEIEISKAIVHKNVVMSRRAQSTVSINRSKAYERSYKREQEKLRDNIR